MTQLNLPPFKARLSGTPDSPKIFDMLRRKYVALTPEESVRQHFIHFLVDHKGYPAALLANELPLTCGNKQLRADTVLYDRELKHRNWCPRVKCHACFHAGSVYLLNRAV